MGRAMGGAVAKLTAREIGDLGEAAVRSAYDIGPKELTRMFGRTRFPDGILPTVLTEVKNVAQLSYTRQLRDYAAFATQTGRSFDLYVRSNTALSGTLQTAIDAGMIIRKVIPGL
jgi:Restriction endonuclease fold toxin 7